MNATEQLDRMILWEEGRLPWPDAVDFFSDLVTSGLAWSLQGTYGRTAQALIDSGYLDEYGAVLTYGEDAIQDWRDGQDFGFHPYERDEDGDEEDGQ